MVDRYPPLSADEEAQRDRERDDRIAEHRGQLADYTASALRELTQARKAAETLAQTRLYDVDFAEGDAPDVFHALDEAARQLRNIARTARILEAQPQ